METTDARSTIAELARLLEAEGKVKTSFLKAVLEREAEFPTGLPTPGAAIAIPHADPQHCIEPAVAVGILKNPVGFAEMGSPQSTLDVRIVFLLSVTRPEDHVEWLSKLASAFQNPQFAQRLLEAKSPPQACNLLRNGIEAPT